MCVRRVRLLSFLLFGSMVPLAAPAQDKQENPLKHAKVGDYVTFRMTTTTTKGKEFSFDVKQLVTAKDEMSLTLKSSLIIKGKEQPGQINKVDLGKPLNLPGVLLQGTPGTFEKNADGKEKIKLGDKSYDCTWISGKVTGSFKGNKIESNAKIWIAKGVPLTGVVKMELKSEFADVRLELTGSGSEK